MKPDLAIGYVGFGAYVPSTVLTNHDLEQIVDTTDEWIQRRTGIRERHILAEDETILDMAVATAQQALDDAGLTAEQIGDIRVGVNTWARFPSLATQVQAAIGATGASAADVSAGCAGFVYAVEEAYNKIYVSKRRDGEDLISLVIGVDGLSHITNWKDRGTCVLLGDGAGAVVMRQVDRGGILSIHTHADGRYGDYLYSDSVLETQWDPGAPEPFSNKKKGVRPYLHMNGRKVYGVAVRTMVNDIHAVVEKYNRDNPDPVSLDDVSFVYPHQANLRIIESVASKLGMPLDRVYTNGIMHFGNTSTASIPIGYLDVDARTNGAPRRGIEIDVAFGAGFASGAILREVA